MTTWEVTVKFTVEADGVAQAYEAIDRQVRYNDTPYVFIGVVAEGSRR